MVVINQNVFIHSFRGIGAIMLLAFSSFCFALPQLAGSKTAYHYDTKQTITPVPKGYQAFYINHIGRHGSRYISKSKYEEIAYQTLLLADKDNQLTDEGKSLLKQVLYIKQLNNNHYGELTDLGRQDIGLISQRMLANNPTVFKGHNIAVISSTSPRAKETAEIFVQPFKAKYPHIQVTTQPENGQTLLRFFNYSPAYDKYKQSKAVKNALKEIKFSPKTIALSQTVAMKFFTHDFIEKLNVGMDIGEYNSIKTEDFSLAVYQLYQELQALPTEVLVNHQLNFDDYFSEEANAWFNTVVTAKNYLQIGPAFDANGIQIKIAAPLLRNMLMTADNAITNNNVDANLRFAHAETLSPLATLMEIEGTTKVAKTLFDYPTVWHAEKIIPMGANIQWIFYKSEQPHHPILVKILLNEQEVHLPISTQQYPYYRWQDVKQFYTNKLNQLGLNENQPDIDMLKKLK